MPKKKLYLFAATILFSALLLITGITVNAEDEIISTSINDTTIDAKPTEAPAAQPDTETTQIPADAATATPAETLKPAETASETETTVTAAETATPAADTAVEAQAQDEGTEGIIILQPGETEAEELEKFILSRRVSAAPAEDKEAESEDESTAKDNLKFDYDEDESAKLVIMQGKEKSRIENTGYVMVERAGFISDNFTQDGTLYSKTGKSALGQGDKVYVDITVGKGFKPGTEFIVYDDSEEAIDPETEGYLGKYIQVCAVGKILANVKDSKYEAKLVKSYNLVRDRFKIKLRRDVKEYHKKLTAKTGKKNVKLDGYIIKAANGINAISKNDIVYINRGTEKNILPGQKFNIIRTEKDPVTKDIEDYHVIGTAMAVNSLKSTCVAVITSQNDLIRAGDLVRTAE